jgi:formylglycine-generating enzyme required for sulfatase activity
VDKAAASDGAYTVATTNGEGRPGATITPGAEAKTYSFVWNMAADNPNRAKTNSLAVKVRVAATLGDYMRIDLDTYKVTRLTTGPDITNDECRSKYLWLREILAAGKTFGMGADPAALAAGDVQHPSNDYKNEDYHQVTFTKNFYIGVFEVTQAQWVKVMGANPVTEADHKGDDRPVGFVSYNMIRGTSAGAGWPANNAVDAGSFLGILREKIKAEGTAIDFDLPTDAQWEYACRAETTTGLNNGTNVKVSSNRDWGIYATSSSDIYQTQASIEDPNLSLLGRYCSNFGDNKGGYNKRASTKVGSYLPNNWGLYDMHGNLKEWCLDWSKNKLGTTSVTDPVGDSTGTYRALRGGSFWNQAAGCRSPFREGQSPSSTESGRLGFRLAYTVPAP